MNRIMNSISETLVCQKQYVRKTDQLVLRGFVSMHWMDVFQSYSMRP